MSHVVPALRFASAGMTSSGSLPICPVARTLAAFRHTV